MYYLKRKFMKKESKNIKIEIGNKNILNIEEWKQIHIYHITTSNWR